VIGLEKYRIMRPALLRKVSWRYVWQGGADEWTSSVYNSPFRDVRLQAKRHREQARLRPHGDPPSAGFGNDTLPREIPFANRTGASSAAIYAVYAPDAPDVAPTTSGADQNGLRPFNPQKS
jgi:hypothetical protein